MTLIKTLLIVAAALVGFMLSEGCIYLMNLPSFLAYLGALGLVTVIGLEIYLLKYILKGRK